MRAVVVRGFGGPEVVEVREVPVPRPGPGEVRVRVAAAPVAPADLLTREGAMVRFGAAVDHEQVGLGSDLAGTVDAIGADVRGVAVGDAVIGHEERLDLPVKAQAEYAVLPDWATAPAPKGASMAEASTLPLNALTADQALAHLALRRGEWLLVTGAAGSVGGFAVELARTRGVRVVAQAAEHDEELVRGFGAEVVLPRGADLATVRALVPGGVHGVVDAANIGVAALDAVRAGGAFAALLNNAPLARRGIRVANIAYRTDGARLVELSALASAGLLTLRVARTYPLEQVAEAHEAVAAGGLRGRVVLVP